MPNSLPNIANQTAFLLPTNFRINEVSAATALRAIGGALPSLGPLGPLAAVTFSGSGFNTIFRPDNSATPTVFPTNPVVGPADNVLELNLTTDNISFAQPLGSVPNRGSGAQGDIFFNGLPYMQTVTDVTIPSQPQPIHLEPGLWLNVGKSAHPAEGTDVVRMASIPHGTTVVAQGTVATVPHAPVIPSVDITPFTIGNPASKFAFPSQKAASGNTRRIPQNLAPFITAGTITQAILDDPNSILRAHIAGQTIISTDIITIDTHPATPLFGGGTDNIAFLMGDAAAASPNANAIRMTATFWVETVEHLIHIPVIGPGHPPFVLPAFGGAAGNPMPHFTIAPPHPIPAPITIKVHSTQIQYSQTVFLNFNGLTWPHVSLATIVPAAPQSVPPSAWP